MRWLSFPPLLRRKLRFLVIAGVALIVVDVVWGAVADPVLGAFASQVGGYSDPLVNAALLVTHLVVEVGTPLGSVLIGSAISVSLVCRYLASEAEKRIL